MVKFKDKLFNPVLSNIIKGALIAVSVSLVLILVFALLIKFLNIPDGAIQPVNQAIKIVSILFGVRAALKHFPKKGLVTGAVIGITYTILAYVFFSFLSGKFVFSANLFIDALFSLIIGGLCGVFFVNRKLKHQIS